MTLTWKSWNFTNKHFFLYESVLRRFYVVTVCFCNFLAIQNWQKKLDIKCRWNWLKGRKLERGVGEGVTGYNLKTPINFIFVKFLQKRSNGKLFNLLWGLFCKPAFSNPCSTWSNKIMIEKGSLLKFVILAFNIQWPPFIRITWGLLKNDNA